MTTLESLLNSKLPRCLNGVVATRTSPIDKRDCVIATFTLTSKRTGEIDCRILGYPLADYNPSCKGDSGFVGPLHLRWNDDSVTLLFDSESHGYHGEMNASAKIRGTGQPNVYRCVQCGGDCMRVTVQFDYWDACEELLEEEPTLPVQDYFNNVVFTGTCGNCGTTNRILDMDL